MSNLIDEIVEKIQSHKKELENLENELNSEIDKTKLTPATKKYVGKYFEYSNNESGGDYFFVKKLFNHNKAECVHYKNRKLLFGERSLGIEINSVNTSILENELTQAEFNERIKQIKLDLCLL